jgi:hypothetical protein
MLKKILLFLLFLSSSYGANSTVVYANGVYNCVYMANFWKDGENFTVHQQLVKGGTITGWWTADTGTQQNDRPIYTDTKIFLNVPNCELTGNEVDVLPAIKDYIFTNNITTYVYDIVADNRPITNTIPQSYFDEYIAENSPQIIESDLDIYQLNFLYGLSGIICASFLLLRISSANL